MKTKTSIALFLLVLMSVSSAWAKDSITYPKPGSEVRKQICNAFRIPMTQQVNGQKIVFVIHRLAVLNKNTAFIFCSIQRANGKSVDWKNSKLKEAYEEGFFDNSHSGLLRKNSQGKWVVVDYIVGMTDVGYMNWPKKHKVPKKLIFKTP